MDHPTNPTNYVIPRNDDFATEVKSDRLAILWKVTVAGALLVMLVLTSMLSFPAINAQVWIIAPIVLVVGCLLTGQLLKRDHYTLAAWTYTFACIGAVIVAMPNSSPITLQILPFFFVVIVFIVGLLLHPASTFVLAAITAVLAIIMPLMAMNWDWSALTAHQYAAVALIFISAGLASQVTGELYAVTEWALMNYQRERRTNFDLFESRNQLHRALKRSEALGDKLKEINAELEKAHAAAEAAKQFRGQFLANMSHELRTPLNAIIGFSETMLKFPMMYDDQNLPSIYEKDMGQILYSGQQLLVVINDILDLARVDAGKLEIYMERVELDEIVENVQSIARGLLAKKPVELQTDLPETLPVVWGDATRVRQILVNLYSNACKFTDKGFVKLIIRETDDEVRFSVQDTGSGIDPDQLEAIFEEFQQADAARGRDPRAGAGLGLAISRQLVRLMDGRIYAESTPGEGSTFHVILQPYHKAKVETLETTGVTATP